MRENYYVATLNINSTQRRKKQLQENGWDYA